MAKKPYRVLKARSGYELQRLEKKAGVFGASRYKVTKKGDIYRKFAGKEGNFQVFEYRKK